jgi:hypothetical protein
MMQVETTVVQQQPAENENVFNMARVSPACKDVLIRVKEWRAVLDDEALRQVEKSKYAERMEAMLDSESDREFATYRASVVNRLTRDVVLLQKYVEDGMAARNATIVRTCCGCLNIVARLIATADSTTTGRNRVCVFTGQTDDRMYDVHFITLEPGSISFTESDHYTISHNYVMLLYACYTVAHSFGLVKEAVTALRSDNEAEQTRGLKLEKASLKNINESARIMYCFFSLNHDKHASIPASTPGCICSLEKAMKRTVIS